MLDDIPQIDEIDIVLDDLSSPTSLEVFEALLPFEDEMSTAAIGAIALTGGGGGSPTGAAGGVLGGTYPNPGFAADMATQAELDAEAVLRAAGDVANVRLIAQVGHGLAVGDAVRFNGTAYVKALASTAANAEVVGLVSAVASANAFTLATGGLVTGLSGLTAGTVYFLSPTVAGALTATEPSTVGQVSKPLLVADSTTSGYLFNFRGVLIADSGSGGARIGWLDPPLRQTYADFSQSIAPASNVALEWTAVIGDDLLDLTDPQFPAVRDAGVYQLDGVVECRGAQQAGKVVAYDYNMDYNDYDLERLDVFALDGPIRSWTGFSHAISSKTLMLYCPAGAVLAVLVHHDSAAAIDFAYTFTVQRLT